MSAGTHLSDEDSARLSTLQALLDVMSEVGSGGGLRKHSLQALALQALAIVDAVLDDGPTRGDAIT